MSGPVLADLVPDNHVDIDVLVGSDHALLTYAGGEVRFRHRCDRGERGVVICAPALRLGAGHTLSRDAASRPTVSPSILCEDCGTHGFVTDGHWTSS